MEKCHLLVQPCSSRFWPSTADTGRPEIRHNTMHAVSDNPVLAEAVAATGGGGSPGSWAEMYKQERYLHTVCAMLAVRSELMSFLDNMPSPVRECMPEYAQKSTLRLYCRCHLS
jgi:hypothetical protein